jgi:putative membrane protein
MQVLRFVAVRDRQAFAGIGLFSAAALAFLVWLIYFAGGTAQTPAWAQALPPLNAALNGASALCALGGFMAIRGGRRRLHRGLMLWALVFSALFLVSYVSYHHFHGETRFGGQGWIRPVYFFVLITHVGLSALVLPLLLTVVWFAGIEAFARHRTLARWVLPLWLYVSVTGVLVYGMLRPYY